MDKFDIVIVGAGPAGLMLSTCLQRWGYKIKHIDNRAEPTLTGRADGIQPRSLELLRNMGLKRKFMAHEPAKLYEVAFWDPSARGIHRTDTWPSCPRFIDTRYPFTTLLHQGFIERVFIQDVEKNGGQISRPWTITDLANDGVDPTYPLRVSLAHLEGQEKQTVKAKYLFSGEGARSLVREKLGIKVRYRDAISHVWGVIDGVVQTDFPDIKMKCNIRSESGSLMIIPRENNMARLYVQIASSTDQDWNPRMTATKEDVQAVAKRILRPYSIEWDRVEWCSVYPIGQGIAEKYTLDNRIFMGGDCCHTHSPKAGQGMNMAFMDAANLAWKIHHVESGFAESSLLSTYESERKSFADNLLSFDEKYAKLFCTRKPKASDLLSADTSKTQTDEKEENEFVKTFKESCELTSGYGVAYDANALNWSIDHAANSPLFLSFQQGTSLRTGRILNPATVTRVADANVVHLEQEIPLNGAFRIYIFAGRLSTTFRALQDFAKDLLSSKFSLLASFARPDAALVSVHERFNPHSYLFTIATILNARRTELELSEDLPPVLQNTVALSTWMTSGMLEFLKLRLPRTPRWA